MSESLTIPMLVAVLIVAGALAGCDRRDDVPRPKADAPEAAAPKGAAAGAATDRSKGASPSTAAAVAEGDRIFAEKAASAGLAEVAITKHTMDKAASADVKKIAEHLHKDHSQANEDLKKIAAAKGIALPAAPQGEKKAEARRGHCA